MIEGRRVRLRAVECNDIARSHEWLNDAEVTAGLDMYLPRSMAEEEQWFERLAPRDAEERPLSIEVKDREGWRLIGDTGLFNLEWPSRSAEFAIFIGEKSSWKQGHGTEALELVLQHGFQTLNLNRIFLRVFGSNPRARRSYEKAGFVLEGTMQQALYDRASTWMSTHERPAV